MPPAIETLKKARCGCCRGPIGRRVNLVLTGKRATWQYPVAGNVITGEHGEATGVCCDRCTPPTGAKLLEAVEFRGEEIIYHPLDELTPMQENPT